MRHPVIVGFAEREGGGNNCHQIEWEGGVNGLAEHSTKRTIYETETFRRVFSLLGALRTCYGCISVQR